MMLWWSAASTAASEISITKQWISCCILFFITSTKIKFIRQFENLNRAEDNSRLF